MPRRRSIATAATSTPHLVEITSRKVAGAVVPFAGAAPEAVEALSAWVSRYLTLAVVGVRSEEVADKIALHLERFATFSLERFATFSKLGFVHFDRRSSGERQSISEAIEEGARDFDDLVG